jgi:hypothetical protein
MLVMYSIKIDSAEKVPCFRECPNGGIKISSGEECHMGGGFPGGFSVFEKKQAFLGVMRLGSGVEGMVFKRLWVVG